MRNNILKIFVIGLLIFAVSCQPVSKAGNASEGVSVVDALGRELVIEKEPQSVVVAGKQTPMIIDLLYLFPDAGLHISGIENRAQTTKNFLEVISPESVEKVNLEKGAGAEQIAALKPDLVILKTSMAEEVGAGLDALGIPILYVSLESIVEIEQDIRNIGDVLGYAQRAQEIIDKYAELQKSVDDLLAVEENEKAQVLLLQYSENGGEVAFKVPAASWLQTNMIEMAGGTPVWKDDIEGGGWVTVNMEQIARWDADQIFIVNYFGDSQTIVDALYENELWQELNATRNMNVFAFPGDFISWDQPDSRWILGYYWIATKINPEGFSDQTMDEVIIEFYVDLYDLDPQVVQEEILPIVYGDL